MEIHPMFEIQGEFTAYFPDVSYSPGVDVSVVADDACPRYGAYFFDGALYVHQLTWLDMAYGADRARLIQMQQD
jgi:hypothetical protein